MDSAFAVLLLAGIVMLFTSWLMLLAESFKAEFVWGLTTLLAPPLGYAYALFEWPKTSEPLLLSVLAWAMIFIALA